jgi:hypothetical protein
MFPVFREHCKFARSLFGGSRAAAAALCCSMLVTAAHAQYQRTDLVSNQASFRSLPLRSGSATTARGSPRCIPRLARRLTST